MSKIPSMPVAANRLVLLSPTRGSRGRDNAAVRRYRIARLRVEGREPGDSVRGPGRAWETRHAHLKRIYD